ISLLSDFGLRDPSAAIMRGVVLGIVPDARVVDISHEVRKFSIRDGALLLWCALPYLPVGFHVAVVDPGVGTARLPVAIATARGDVLIGPDNGLLVAAAGRLGGIGGAHVLEAEAYRLPTVSTSFHGRDVFAPAAAHLARGVGIGALGRAIDPAALVPSPIRDPEVVADELHSSVVYVDTFGNVKLAGLRADLEAAIGPVRPGDRLELTLGRTDPGRVIATTWQATFGDVAVGEDLVYEDSYGRLCVAASQADAAARHGLVDDLELVVRRA
ncbi:MAG TPA: SAM-dependent chlorinase/fluorinase, partial [Candidatus Deferrimicrobium sp.]|nr:SAM-dependent chlorinase/fluorinase [Candidatus Deferrimicrobium sp.]